MQRRPCPVVGHPWLNPDAPRLGVLHRGSCGGDFLGCPPRDQLRVVSQDPGQGWRRCPSRQHGGRGRGGAGDSARVRQKDGRVCFGRLGCTWAWQGRSLGAAPTSSQQAPPSPGRASCSLPSASVARWVSAAFPQPRRTLGTVQHPWRAGPSPAPSLRGSAISSSSQSRLSQASGTAEASCLALRQTPH